jgi:hypothetical protein
MKHLFIEKTQQTPEINLQTNGDFLLKGISTPNNVQRFYQPVFDWLNEFKAKAPKKIKLTMEMEYLNTSSSRIFVELLVLVNSFKQQGVEVSFVWRYDEEDEDIYDLGDDLRLSSKTEFVFETI